MASSIPTTDCAAYGTAPLRRQEPREYEVPAALTHTSIPVPPPSCEEGSNTDAVYEPISG